MWLINNFFFLFILLCPFLGCTQVQQVKSLDGLLAQGRPKEIAALLKQAEAQFKAKRLTEPAGNNAEATYRQVLALDAGNTQAQAGLERIARKYLQQARQRRSAGALQESLNLIAKGLAVLPNQADLLRLQEEVSGQLAAEQQKKLEQQRLEQQREEQQRLAQQRQQEKPPLGKAKKPARLTERYRNGPAKRVELEEPQQLVQFPWPPPRASATEIIHRELLEAKWEPTLLRDVDSKITQALKQTGYYESSYYAVPKGFAIATRIEQIEEDGSPKKEPQRWSLESQPTSFTLAAYLKALFFSTPGYYRVIVFVVTPYPLTQSPAETTPEEAKKWLSGGHNRLPESIGNMEFLQTYACTALIYEFERETESEEPRFRQPGRILGHTHLVKAGIWQSLEQ